MPQEVFPGIYRIEIPIPNNPLKALNSYVITGSERPLVVDVGLNREECIAAMKQGLAELGIDPAQADYCITHMHADHSGAIGVLADRSANIYASRIDAQLINKMGASSEHWGRMKEYAIHCGFPEMEADKAIQGHPGFRYGNKENIAFTTISDGAVIQAGDYQFTCIETPGHTKGHICLYEPSRRILISGDHILPGITPNISTWTDGENPLATFLKSLEKVAGYEVSLFLPGHRWGNVDCRARIDQLVKHHDHRSQDTLNILQHAVLTPFQVAASMRWDLSYTSWDQFPAAQKWFAAGEAAAHLQFLESKGQIVRVISGEGLIQYKLR